jgi:hypothetical protein
MLIWMSDDELDLANDTNRCSFPTKPMVPGLDAQMIKVRVGEEVDLDEVPSAHAFQCLVVGARK